MITARTDFLNVHVHKRLQYPSNGIGLRSHQRNCRRHCQTSKRKAVMKFVSLRPKQTYRPRRLVKRFRASQESPAAPTVAPHQIHTYAELRKQIHDDLRIQHPEWIQPNGESPICDSYEARLMELLEHSRPRLA
jgi:hypothetical protein